jgi:thiol-disulfide isomerase/thioredoxin
VSRTPTRGATTVGPRRLARYRYFVVGVLVCLAATSGGAQEVEVPAWKGGPTPPLALKDPEGRLHDLADYRGKVVVVNFWATWCEPCRDELPSLERLRDALRGRPFEVLAVNVAEGDSRVKRFLAEVPLQLPVLLDRNGEAQRAWKVRGLPATFLLDREGEIRSWYLGELDWAQPKVLRTVENLLPAVR